MLVVDVPYDAIISSAPILHSPKGKSALTAGANDSVVCSDIIHSEDSTVLKCSLINSDTEKDSKSVRIDISFKTPSHTGLQTSELVISFDCRTLTACDWPKKKSGYA